MIKIVKKAEKKIGSIHIQCTKIGYVYDDRKVEVKRSKR